MSSRETQAEANYRKGDPINNCGICSYFQGGTRCSEVMGAISPFGLCDVWKAAPNPFGANTLSPQEKIAIKQMAADATDRSGGAEMAGEAEPPPQRPMPTHQTMPTPQPRPFFNG